MFRITETEDSLEVSVHSRLTSILCSIFLVTTPLQGWQLYQAGDLGPVKGCFLVVITLALAVGLWYSAIRCHYRFDSNTRTLAWSRKYIGKTVDGQLPFNAITSIGLDARAMGGAVMTKVVVFSDSGDVPLGLWYTTNREHTRRIETSANQIVFGAEPVQGEGALYQNVRELLNRGQTLQATVLLKTQLGLSAADARDRVKTIAAANRSLE